MTAELTEAQRRALFMEESVCVTAGAGTGKTFLLTKRYIAALTYRRETMHTGASDILALTYTDKAAAEMRTKIGRELKKAAEEDPELEGVWESFSRCSISTFHGFCLSLLKEFAYEAGLDAGFSVMDELDTHELVTGTIREMLEHPPATLFGDVVTLFDHLREATIAGYLQSLMRIEGAKDWFSLLEKNPSAVIAVWQKAWDEEITAYRDDLAGDELVNALMAELRALAPERKGELFQAGPAAFAAFCDANGPAEMYAAGKLLAGINTNAYKAPLPKGGLERFKEKREVFKEFPTHPDESDPRTRLTFEILAALGRVASAVSERTVREKQQRGVLDFDDLIQKTRDLIENDAVQKTLNARYRYILVDEVQDNDPVLTDIIRILCGDPKENNRLFIVGDAKQSIYLFRGADVSGFNAFQTVFANDPVELDTSFRTVPEIIRLVNHVFSSVFADPKEIWEAGYGELTPHRAGHSGSVTLIRLPTGETKAESMRREARTLASWIFDTVSRKKLSVYDKDGTCRPARFGDIAVLIEARTHMDKLRHALESYGVPYTEEKGYSFYQKQEVFDFTNLLKAIVYPEEDIPLYGVLKSPYFGISDAELCRAAAGSGRPLIWRLRNYATANPDSKIGKAVGDLARWHAEIGTEPFVPFLSRLIAESGIAAVYGGLPFGREATANLEKLVAIARSRSMNRPFSVYEYLGILDTCMEEEFDEREGMVPSEEDDRVKILTVHASKGLEYPILALCFAGTGDGLKVSAPVFDAELGVGIPVRLAGEGEGLSFVIECLKPEMKAKLLAERKRLFYVAMTRARDHLVISGTDGKKGPETNSFLSMYDAGISGCPYLPELITDCVAEPGDLCRIRPKVPDGWTDTPLPTKEEEAAQSLTAAVRNRTPSAAEEAAMLRGTALHEVFEGKPADAAVKRYGLPPAAAEEFAAKYAAFLASPLMQNAAKSICEQEVAFSFEGTPLNGVIDRLVQYEDGSWMIIDYKTGRPSKMELERYESQLAVYFLWAKRLFGKDPEVCLYLSDKNEVVSFTMDEERAMGLVAEKMWENRAEGEPTP
ncbi:UvrD/REP helicase [Methanocorpusculum labreanum Z]|uniref:DNA 3'-5' helicase n=1 Tax=Methanocorpusculum labreanum (strain ATCC 43576 / DSM 4855 / Z) TaxID=410358 RepID=A2ST33_METLZ|nr:UvrD-helicase domain-containing protein [Methanocorpusculum labreanum]ABN07489.1 UvrD/REP helicase [Methanocorpusculum labreanum Z]